MNNTSPTDGAFIAYLRVSTQRQGTTGVSLSEQRLAIEHHARQHDLRISQWFTETRSAARESRPMFQEVLELLQSGKARGLLVHKIDRSARNLTDWAQLGTLIDHGIDIRFVHDKLDLQSRGGRLAADVQAVIAADYIRNLRDETRKGMRGRFRQGLYPLPAPLGYIDNGRGRIKSLDPLRTSLLQQAFSLYAFGNYSLRTLRLEMHSRGLRNRLGHPVSLNGWSRILNNSFYIGRLYLRHTQEVFFGAHEPLISQTLFQQVQDILRQRGRRISHTVHSFLFRRLLRCSRCTRFLVGERQKGRVYYRCHTRICRGTSLSESSVEDAVASALTVWNKELPYNRDLLGSWLTTCTIDGKHIEVGMKTSPSSYAVPAVPNVH